MKIPDEQIIEDNYENEAGFCKICTEILNGGACFEAQKHEESLNNYVSSLSTHIRGEMVEELEGMKKEEMVIEDCESCGEIGYGRAYFGKGAPNDPYGYGDAYYPTGSVVFCKTCAPNFQIGKEWNGEEIWKKTSDREEHSEIRLNHIRKKVKENTGYNQAIDDIISKYKAKE